MEIDYSLSCSGSCSISCYKYNFLSNSSTFSMSWSISHSLSHCYLLFWILTLFCFLFHIELCFPAEYYVAYLDGWDSHVWSWDPNKRREYAKSKMIQMLKHSSIKMMKQKQTCFYKKNVVGILKSLKNNQKIFSWIMVIAIHGHIWRSRETEGQKKLYENMF